MWVARTLLVGLLAGLVAVGSSVPALASAQRDASDIAWGPCEPGAPAGFECAQLVVPMDADDPALGTVTLALTRLPATSNDRLGALVYNPGGPAAEGRTSLWGVAALVDPAVRERWDLVTWDPRGTGATTPRLRNCRAVGPADLGLPATGPVDWSAGVAHAYRVVAQRNRECLRANPILARHMGSLAAVDDVESIRVALGEERIGFWGFSYGTTIGFAYALEHPHRLSRLYLDSTVNPALGLGALLNSFSWAVGPAFSLMAQRDPLTYATWLTALGEVAVRPVRLPGGRLLTRWDVHLLMKLASSPADADLMLAAVRGDRMAQAEIAASLGYIDAVGLWGGPRSVIICADFARRPDVGDARRLVTRAGRMAGQAGRGFAVGSGATCAGLPRTMADPVPRLGYRESDVPALIAASTADPALLLGGAIAMATGFRSGRLITVVNNSHGLWNSGRSACLDRRVSDYLLTGRLPRTNLACPPNP